MGVCRRIVKEYTPSELTIQVTIWSVPCQPPKFEKWEIHRIGCPPRIIPCNSRNTHTLESKANRRRVVRKKKERSPTSPTVTQNSQKSQEKAPEKILLHSDSATLIGGDDVATDVLKGTIEDKSDMKANIKNAPEAVDTVSKDLERHVSLTSLDSVAGLGMVSDGDEGVKKDLEAIDAKNAKFEDVKIQDSKTEKTIHSSEVVPEDQEDQNTSETRKTGSEDGKTMSLEASDSPEAQESVETENSESENVKIQDSYANIEIHSLGDVLEVQKAQEASESRKPGLEDVENNADDALKDQNASKSQNPKSEDVKNQDSEANIKINSSEDVQEDQKTSESQKQGLEDVKFNAPDSLEAQEPLELQNPKSENVKTSTLDAPKVQDSESPNIIISSDDVLGFSSEENVKKLLKKSSFDLLSNGDVTLGIAATGAKKPISRRKKKEKSPESTPRYRDFTETSIHMYIEMNKQNLGEFVWDQQCTRIDALVAPILELDRTTTPEIPQEIDVFD